MNNFKKRDFRPSGDDYSFRSEKRSKFGDNKKFGSKFGGGRDRSGRPGKRMELFPAVCFECKQNCEVPFRPTGDKPVYCSSCFNKQPHVPGRNSLPGERLKGAFRSEMRSPQREYQPQPDSRIQDNSNQNLIKQQLEALEVKMNRILELLTQKTESLVSKTPVVAEIVKTEKLVKTKAPTQKTKTKNKK